MTSQGARDAWELASFVVTALGLPFAIAFFAWEQRKERDNEDEEGYQLLSNAYNDFLKVVLANPDLPTSRHDRDGSPAGAGTAGTTICGNGAIATISTTPCHCFCAARIHNSRVICAALPKRSAAPRFHTELKGACHV